MVNTRMNLVKNLFNFFESISDYVWRMLIQLIECILNVHKALVRCIAKDSTNVTGQ